MNPILLQKQLKENANDLQDFYKDLQNWGEEMKRKENSLKNEDDSKTTKIRSSDKVKEICKGKLSKSGSTDYAKWEKFDADLECEHLEDDIKDDSELTDEFEESVRDEALVYKEKGNNFVKTKEWDKAIECYTKAIKCYSYDAVFYANRALCHLKKQNFTTAEEDCTLSLKLDSTYVKALQRRAAARESLGKLELAITDLEKVVTHEPKNKESIAALENIRKKMGPKEKVIEDQQRPVSKFTASRSKIQSSRPVIPSETPTGISQKTILDNPKFDTSGPSTSSWPSPGCEVIPVKAIDKRPHLRSTKQLRRVEITEIDSFSNVSEKIQIVENNAVKKHVVENVKKVIFSENIEVASEPVEITSAFKKKRDEVNRNNKELSKGAWPTPNSQNVVIRSDDLKILEKKRVVEHTVKDSKNNENLFITKLDNKTITDINGQTPEVKNFISDFLIPKTSVQFYATWKNLKTPAEKYKYLRIIDPSDISNLFQESLESNVFSSILDILSTQFIEHGENVYTFLNGFTQVKRFSAMTMFMDSTDKNRLWKMITYLRDIEKSPKEDVDNLILKYEL